MEKDSDPEVYQLSAPVIFDAKGRPVSLAKMRGKVRGQARALFAGFQGANDKNLADWSMLPVEINTILRNDLQKLRARSRDLARNDDTVRRFLSLLKQNVPGHAGIKLQAKNKLADGKTLDSERNVIIEREWSLFCGKRRYRGGFVSASACGQMSMREIAWLSLATRAIDGECFIQILRGYPHNRHRFAVRFLNPDLLDSGYCTELPGGRRIEMGIEFDEFDRPIAYHFSEQHPNRKFTGKNQRRQRIPAAQIIHIFRHEFVGQIRGIPDFASIMHKTKMLHGVHEAIVVGWRVAASKMGFFTAADPGHFYREEDEESSFDASEIEATPGSFDMIPSGMKLETFDPEYPTSTYESGHKVFMQQLANGLNVSTPTLSNNYADVNYSSLRQALLEDREGWRCLQAEMIDGFYQPLFDEWYDWTVNTTRLISVAEENRNQDPVIVWQPRGWPWVDPLKEVNAQLRAIDGNIRTRQSIIAETSGADFTETADELADENKALKERGLLSDAVNNKVAGNE